MNLAIMRLYREHPAAARPLMGALVLLAVSAVPLGAQWNAGFLGGYAGGISKEGVPNFEAKFGASNTFGAVFGYRFRSGFSLAGRAERLSLPLTETGDTLGSLRITPLLISAGYQGRPRKGRGFSGHVQAGVGVALSSFQTGPWIRALESQTGVRFDVRTSLAPVFEFGSGLDYFLSRKVSLTSDFRVLATNVGARWTAAGGNATVAIADMDKFAPSTGQVLAGIRFWLK